MHPNAIVRMINKSGQVVPFDIDRIQTSIKKALVAVEGCSDWEATARSAKYADLVCQHIHASFYNFLAVRTSFLNRFAAYDANERRERITRLPVEDRLIVLLADGIANGPEITPGIISEHIDAAFSDVDQQFLDILKPDLLKKIVISLAEPWQDRHYFPDRNLILDSIESTLREIGEISLAEGFMIYREGKAKVAAGFLSPSQFTDDGIYRPLLRQTQLWNIRHECESIFQLGEWVLGKNGRDFKQLMELCDHRFYADVEAVVERLLTQSVKLVIVAGPSCSNKTTVTAVLAQELAKRGKKLKQLNVDDYFLDLVDHPKDAFGDTDFEMPEALDTALLCQHLRCLMRGSAIDKPCYDFKRGCRNGSETMTCHSDEVIILDCLHGLSPALTQSIPKALTFSIYTESMNVLRDTNGAYTKWADVRLLKRMIRDHQNRGHCPNFTLSHWAYVRKGELKHIIPYVYAVDAVINTGLPYELPVLKSVVASLMPDKLSVRALADEGRLDAYIRGIRVHALLDTILPYDLIAAIDDRSPLREFIGGSAYLLRHNGDD